MTTVTGLGAHGASAAAARGRGRGRGRGTACRRKHPPRPRSPQVSSRSDCRTGATTGSAEPQAGGRRNLMARSGGGTTMWCPQCKRAQKCRYIPGRGVTDNTKDYGRLWYFASHQDVQFLQRGRECLSCGYRFLTTECDMQFLRELIELRNALVAIRSNAESYMSESKRASDSLSALHQSLSVLKALKLSHEG